VTDDPTPPGDDLDRCVHGRYRIDWCTFCGRRYVDGVLVGPFVTDPDRSQSITEAGSGVLP
jgi:hypothetical protein